MTSELDGTPLAGVEVCAYFQWEDHEPSCAVTDAAGRYLVVGLGGDLVRAEVVSVSEVT